MASTRKTKTKTKTKTKPKAQPRKRADALYGDLKTRMPPTVAKSIAGLAAGARSDGFLHFFAPKELDGTLSEWLGGRDTTRTPFARTALGDLLYVRDLRKRAKTLGIEPALAKNAHDVSLVDVRYKRTKLLAYDVDMFLQLLGDPAWLAAELRRDLFDAALPRLGAPKRDEIYAFVPALALGGSEDPATLARHKADVALDILLQL